MQVRKKYVVYALNHAIGSQRDKSLQIVEFLGCKTNRFDTEDEAIQALLDDNKTFEDFVILKEVYITDY